MNGLRARRGRLCVPKIWLHLVKVLVRGNPVGIKDFLFCNAVK
jgi:hypothetical protein